MVKIVAGAVGLVLVAAGVWDAASGSSGATARSQLTLIAPASAGGGWDGAAREIQQVTRSEGIVNNTQVLNIPGAGGVIGLNEVAQMDGESQTLMMMGITMLGAIRVNSSTRTLDDVTPIARLTDDYDVLVVPADSPYDSVDDLVKDWAADPNDFAFGGGSLGSVDQMIIAQLGQAAGIDPLDVNYIAYSGGGELATSLLSGTIKASVSGWADFADQVEAGRLKALAVSAAEPVEFIDVPTLKEEGYNVVLTNWRGIVAPPGISDATRRELEQIVTEVVESPAWDETLERNQWTDTFMVGEEFQTNLAQQTETVNQIWTDLGY
ncbi:Bug family tripartite tricarboxylate transporter substrate binding protein [Nocardioides albus]|uniref:Putative tricarboxylic transport membrane protein n=1 Tax=Nocardioides albus TaxID=1841 RepID=A0A7W5A1M6_9ACTN|nr:tripartite tricarboxylate transporter substrate-binding protein [Nocardioides albus]MBB3088007.1 putative tricarboxylic transport membrane protein [Nocardioides albus]